MTEPQPKEISRWFAIMLGVVMLPLGVFGVLGGYALVIDPPPGNPGLGWIAGSILALLGVTVIIWGGRLIFNLRRSAGGLLSPFALRLGGALLIALPIGGLFTGVYGDKEFGFAHMVQAVVYLSCGIGAFALARNRQGTRGEKPRAK